ncbi:type IV pilus secretin PilQ [Methyloglobulus sp.]|uniref:type IV pilus secretin PilQ n=1 Tax=Methyloglobulus sp. TaxID=2518622 RepID=UPI0032B7ED60
MNNKQGDIMCTKMALSRIARMSLSLFLLLFQITFVNAADLTITGLDVASLSGDKLQIQLEMSGAAVAPKVFQTDNPARIALDFPGVANGLDKKMYPINQGAISSIYVAEAADRVRVVINLIEAAPFDTKIEGNKVLLSLTNARARSATTAMPVANRPFIRKSTPSSVASGLMPEQGIRGIDFKRGDNGEGRILVSLANPDTIVNTREEGGNVVLSFINTRLPDNLSKRLDVSEFATPVKTIAATSTSRETTITAGMQNSLYDYSLFQSEGLLTVEFRPLTTEEKEIQDSKRDKYKGDRLSLNFQDIDIRSVIAILAEFTGQNVVAGDEVQGTITLKMDDVPWDEALDFIMMTKGLEKFESGNVILVAPVGKIKEYKEKQQATEQVVQQLEPLVTEYIRINYARAENFRNLLNGLDTGAFGICGTNKSSGTGSGSSGSSSSSGSGLSSQGSQGGQNQGLQSGQPQGGAGQTGSGNTQNEKFRILSPRGSAVVDARTNTLIVRETAKKLEEAKKLIRRLDVPVRQVMIEVRIAQASSNFAKALGVKFGVAKVGFLDSSKVFGVGGSGTTGTMGTRTTTIKDGVATTNETPESVLLNQGNNSLVDLGVQGFGKTPYGALGMTLARAADYVLNLELQALQDQGLGELLSNPRVMTSDRCKATIKQGEEIPYTSNDPGSLVSTTVFKEAVLSLDVLPQITPSGSVVMSLTITKDARGQITPAGFGINKQELETNVHVMDGETVVLGGAFQETIDNQTNKVPFFGDLPGIGFLFKRNQKIDDKTELLIFVTPKIVKDNLATN